MKIGTIEPKEERESEGRRERRRKGGSTIRRVDLDKLSEVQRIERQALIMSNIGLAVSFAKKFFTKYPWMQRADILGSAKVGLIESIDRFDPKKGALSTYARWWIDHEVIREIDNNERTIRIPTHRVAEMYPKEEEDLSASDEFFMEQRRRTPLPRCTHSLDTPRRNKKGEEGDDLIDFIPSSEEVERYAHYLKIRKGIIELLAFSPDKKGPLNKNEWHVLKRVGMDGETLTAAGRELGYRSKEMPRVLFANAVRKAAKFLRNRGFTPETCFL